MTERLDEFPERLRGEPEVMPWEETAPPVVWPLGTRAGTPLKDFSSSALVRMRGEVERKNGKGSYFQPLIAAIDAVLTERQGE